MAEYLAGTWHNIWMNKGVRNPFAPIMGATILKRDSHER